MSKSNTDIKKKYTCNDFVITKPGKDAMLDEHELFTLPKELLKKPGLKHKRPHKTKLNFGGKRAKEVEVYKILSIHSNILLIQVTYKELLTQFFFFF